MYHYISISVYLSIIYLQSCMKVLRAKPQRYRVNIVLIFLFCPANCDRCLSTPMYIILPCGNQLIGPFQMTNVLSKYIYTQHNSKISIFGSLKQEDSVPHFCVISKQRKEYIVSNLIADCPGEMRRMHFRKNMNSQIKTSSFSQFQSLSA